jgi:hypothetical protein
LSHLNERCDTQSEKMSEINCIFREWCGREDSNLPYLIDSTQRDSDNKPGCRSKAGQSEGVILT